MEIHPALSPDGRWLAYATNESGTWQVVVQPFPEASRGKWQVSIKGGIAPRWRRDDRELYFLDPGGQLYSVPVVTQDRFNIGSPTPLFAASFPNPWSIVHVPYAVGADGQRFLGTVAVEAPTQVAPITVITNWLSVLKGGR
jgi:hypothetical protein